MSDEPRRLLDDPEISELLRGDLEAARNADVGYDAGAGLARLQAAIALPPPAPAPTAGSAGAGKAALWWGAATIGIVGTAVIIAVSQPNAPKTPVPTAAPLVAPSSIPALPSVGVPDDVPTVDLSALPIEKAPMAMPSASAPMTAEERLRAEIKDLAEIRSAVGSNPSQGLERANQGHQKFNGGMFYQEREALAISALVKLGRSAEARARAHQFLATFPKGPYAERIRKETGL